MYCFQGRNTRRLKKSTYKHQNFWLNFVFYARTCYYKIIFLCLGKTDCISTVNRNIWKYLYWFQIKDNRLFSSLYRVSIFCKLLEGYIYIYIHIRRSMNTYIEYIPISFKAAFFLGPNFMYAFQRKHWLYYSIDKVCMRTYSNYGYISNVLYVFAIVNTSFFYFKKVHLIYNEKKYIQK